ncbi:MAG: biotin synthase BioB [Desulfobacteraceae bacterium]|jgi:biotin synthase
MAQQTTNQIIRMILDQPGYELTPEQALSLVHPESRDLAGLFHCSETVRREHKSDNVFLCSIINARSGKCSENCAFCAQSSYHDTKIATYPLLSTEAMTDKAILMEQQGASHYSIVTSGHSLGPVDIDTICRAVENIKKKTNLTICGSLGMLSEKSAKLLISSGMTRYHHNLETARSYFPNICTTHSYDEDLETIHTAAANGFNVCSGGIFGLGESWEQRVELCFTLKDLPVDTVPVNFLNPVKGTRLEKMPLLSPMDALACIALVRLSNPDRGVTVCGGREVTLKDFQSWVYLSGADGLMVGNYLTTSGRDAAMDIEMTRDAGLTRI